MSDLIIVAGGGRDLNWGNSAIANELLHIANGRKVRLLLHGGVRGADPIDHAAVLLSWPVNTLSDNQIFLSRCFESIRNQLLLDLALDEAQRFSALLRCQVTVLVVAFPGGSDAACLVRLARFYAAYKEWPLSVIEIKTPSHRSPNPHL